MDALLRFCQSLPGQVILGLSFVGLTWILGVMAFTTLVRRIIWFVRDSWDH